LPERTFILKNAVKSQNPLYSNVLANPKGDLRGKETGDQQEGRQAPTARFIVAWGIAPGTDRVVSMRAESPFYPSVSLHSNRAGFQPFRKYGHPPWGDASLAPGYDQSAPLALNSIF
jgi:hypothetical protein